MVGSSQQAGDNTNGPLVFLYILSTICADSIDRDRIFMLSNIEDSTIQLWFLIHITLMVTILRQTLALPPGLVLGHQNGQLVL